MDRLVLLTLVAVVGIQSGPLAQVKTPPTKKPPSPTYPAPAAQKSDPAIQQLATDYETAFNKADTSAVAALYTEDALRVTPDGRLLAGREAIAKGYAEAFAGPFKGATLTLHPGTTRNLTPDVALIEGTYEVAGGAKTPQRGRYVNAVLRQRGQWRLASVVTVPEMSSPK
jgi:uncharacterized protein (TIGR02246 family)